MALLRVPEAQYADSFLLDLDSFFSLFTLYIYFLHFIQGR